MGIMISMFDVCGHMLLVKQGTETEMAVLRRRYDL